MGIIKNNRPPKVVGVVVYNKMEVHFLHSFLNRNVDFKILLPRSDLTKDNSLGPKICHQQQKSTEVNTRGPKRKTSCIILFSVLIHNIINDSSYNNNNFEVYLLKLLHACIYPYIIQSNFYVSPSITRQPFIWFRHHLFNLLPINITLNESERHFSKNAAQIVRLTWAQTKHTKCP